MRHQLLHYSISEEFAEIWKHARIIHLTDEPSLIVGLIIVKEIVYGCI
jgi:hypothetical protein